MHPSSPAAALHASQQPSSGRLQPPLHTAWLKVLASVLGTLVSCCGFDKTALSLCWCLQVFLYIQLALACVFTINWVFWFWVAPDELRYIFSSSTAIDFVTIVPEFVLFGLAVSTSVEATADTLPRLNFLRVLR